MLHLSRIIHIKLALLTTTIHGSYGAASTVAIGVHRGAAVNLSGSAPLPVRDYFYRVYLVHILESFPYLCIFTWSNNEVFVGIQVPKAYTESGRMPDLLR